MPWLVTPDGRPLHPSGLGREDHGQGGHKGQCSSGGRWLPGAGGAAHPAAQGTFTGQQADNGPGKGLIATRRPSPSSAGRRTVSPWAPGRPPRPPAAPPLPPAFPPQTLWPPGEAQPAEKLGGVAAAATRAAGPGKTKEGCVRPEVRKLGAGGGRARALLPLRAYCSQGARPHALNKKLTHPATAYQLIDSQTNSRVILLGEDF